MRGQALHEQFQPLACPSCLRHVPQGEVYANRRHQSEMAGVGIGELGRELESFFQPAARSL